MAFGPDGNLYVCEAYKGNSKVLQFTPPTSGYTWNFNQAYATPTASPGLLHLVVHRHDAASTFERLSENRLQDWLKDYTLGQLWEKNVVGGGPFG